MAAPIAALLGSCTGPTFGTPDNPYDLAITDVEVTQGIQDLDNRIPLVLDRATTVRIYAREMTGRTVPDVKANLRVTVGGPVTGGATEGMVFTMMRGPITVDAEGSDRLDPSTTFDFDLDLAILNSFSPSEPWQLKVDAVLNPDRLDDEVTSSNNEVSVTRELHRADPMKIRFVPVHLHDAADPTDPNSPESTHEFGDGPADFVIALTPLRHYPIAVHGAGYHLSFANAPVYPPDHEAGEEWDLKQKSDRNAVNVQLALLRAMDSDQNRIYYGIVPPNNVLGAPQGWTTKTNVAWGSMNHTGVPSWNLTGGSIIAHEIGHRRGLPHVHCIGTESGPTDQYPWPKTAAHPCRLAKTEPGGFYGYDVYHDYLAQSSPVVISNDPDQVSPNAGFPLMGYASPRWISPWEFCRTMTRFGLPGCSISWPAPPTVIGATEFSGTHSIEPDAAERLRLAEQVVYLTGVVDADDRLVTLGTAYAFEPAPAALRARIVDQRIQEIAMGLRSDWSVTIEDAAGEVLYRHVVPFDTESLGAPGFEDEALQSTVLNDLLPLPPGSQRIVVRHRGQAIVSRDISAHPPRLQPGRSRIETGGELAWLGYDADGDQLRYVVLMSRDDGETWMPLQAELQDTRFPLSEELLATLPGGVPLRFMVLASDGMRTAQLVLPGRLDLADRPPIVVISKPEAASNVLRVDKLPLFVSGGAVDLEDGVLAGDKLVWRLDGERIATGPQVVLDELSPEPHRLVLEALDRQDNRSAVSLELRRAY